MKALYVEPTSERTWNRPADTSAAEAHRFLQDAVNDYSLQYQQRYITPSNMLADLDKELFDALTALPNRPTLPLPVHPAWPINEKQALAE
jgi:hypothetical protein